MTKFDLIEAPKLSHEASGLWLEYDGWQDIVQGTIIGTHSNNKETRAYEFTCCWQTEKMHGELKDFRIRSHSDDPNNNIKGTSVTSRNDVRAVALRTSHIWRSRKIKEQENLRQAICDPAVIHLTAQTCWGLAEGWWIGEALLLKPGCYGYRYGCRKEWIEVVPLKGVSDEVARFVFENYIEGQTETTAIEAAQRGLSLHEIKRVVSVEEEHNLPLARDLMEELVASRTSKNCLIGS